MFYVVLAAVILAADIIMKIIAETKLSVIGTVPIINEKNHLT